MESKELTNLITKLILNKKGEKIKILDLRELTPVSDYFVICTASSEPQVRNKKEKGKTMAQRGLSEFKLGIARLC